MNGNPEDSWPLVITGDFRVANRRLSEWLITADEELREMIRACRFPWDLLAIQERVMAVLDDEISGEVHPAAVIEGKLKLGKGSRILPGVFIEGNVVIGEGCKIGPNCYVRGSTAIGDNCIVGQSVEVKNSIILSGTSIGHLSYVGDSILGKKVNFGAGTIVSNFRHDARNHLSAVNGVQMDTGRLKFGTVVGDGVHTGIGTLIYPGRKIGAGMFTLPGDIVRRDLHP
jgi:bifunctional UDP-N-acetylglucosamine pyrophosphorylase/glucosamine-1-phosphate N-acetyltransferase